MGGLGLHPQVDHHHLRPVNKGCWRISCLRPSPPLRPCLALGRPDSLANSVQARRRGGIAVIVSVINFIVGTTGIRTSSSGGHWRHHEDPGCALPLLLPTPLPACPQTWQSGWGVEHPRGVVTRLPGTRGRPHATTPLTWCCGNFVVRTLKKTHFD
ncbi:hypothetical protein J437_LFUL012169 [Ladona fulva]|uniref:Uncharacterized protein n=1 Tax=Ladona fulva TaxID=123851 RepID=A0A8K0P6V6_LADFU|nr:hypothetical protein J437_LFUL012169 [Ladona fulva]